ncbi:MAG TPA: tetratricopeptide repeat protein [Gaiellales bacterium]|nr:tetratricopeptide repeat protein [Gaiellales bacterium]
MTDVTDQSFQQDVVERSRSVPVIVDFWAEWCGPCLQLGPVLEAAVADAGDEIELVKVDIDASPKTAVSYGVQSIPAVKAFKDGRVVDEFVGAVPRSSVDLFLRGLLPSEADRLVELGDIESLRRAVELEPDHPAARGALARLAAAADPVLGPGLAALDDGDTERGLDLLLEALRGAPADVRTRIREVMVGVFTQIGQDHPLSQEYRRRLAAALY